VPAGDTWGISGPDFLAFYIVAAVVLAAYSLWMRLRAGGSGTDVGAPNPDDRPAPGPTTGPGPDTGRGTEARTEARSRAGTSRGRSTRTPQPDELAYLNGGPSMAVYSSLAGLRTAGAVSVGTSSELMVSGGLPPGATRLDHALHDAASRQASARQVRHHSVVVRALDEVRDGLIRAGWLLDDDQRTRARLGGWLMVGLAGLGVVRIVAGMSNDRPVGYLIALVVVSVAAAVGLLWVPRHARTSAGRRVLRQARQAHRHLRPTEAPAWSTYGFTGAALGVALYGAPALWAGDPDLARRAGLNRPGAGSDSGGGGGGSGCSGGGGGGCGGGGCGGGCGG
jgi:uncharacterized protein (TIGR04222 family)